MEYTEGRTEIFRLEIDQRSLGELIVRTPWNLHVPRFRQMPVRLNVENDARGRARPLSERHRSPVHEGRERAEAKRLQHLSPSSSPLKGHFSFPRRDASESS